MDLHDKIDKNILNWRLIYQLFSGILFIGLGCVIFIRAKGYINFLSAGIFGSLLAAYGVYRIVMFIHNIKKKKAEKE